MLQIHLRDCSRLPSPCPCLSHAIRKSRPRELSHADSQIVTPTPYLAGCLSNRAAPWLLQVWRLYPTVRVSWIIQPCVCCLVTPLNKRTRHSSTAVVSGLLSLRLHTPVPTVLTVLTHAPLEPTMMSMLISHKSPCWCLSSLYWGCSHA